VHLGINIPWKKYIYKYDRRSERGEERIPECERRQCDEYERVKITPMTIFDKMVIKKGNIAVTMGLIRWCDLYKEDSTGKNLEELTIYFLNFTIDS